VATNVVNLDRTNTYKLSLYWQLVLRVGKTYCVFTDKTKSFKKCTHKASKGKHILGYEPAVAMVHRKKMNEVI